MQLTEASKAEGIGRRSIDHCIFWSICGLRAQIWEEMQALSRYCWLNLKIFPVDKFLSETDKLMVCEDITSLAFVTNFTQIWQHNSRMTVSMAFTVGGYLEVLTHKNAEIAFIVTLS